MLIDCPVQVSPLASHFYVCLIHKPPDAGSVAARPRRLDELGGEALDPPVDGHVIDGDTALGHQLLAIAVGQAIAQVQRTATEITSRGNLKPANTEDEPDDITTPVSCPPRSTNATVPY